LTDIASEPPDGLVVAAVLDGDRDQFAELVRRYRGALIRVAHSRLGRREWAEDVVQETFLNAFKSLHTYDSQFSFRTWLWTILLNQCHRHYKKRGARLPTLGWSDQLDGEPTCARQAADQGSLSDSPVDHLLATERSERLNAILDQLPEHQADALRLRFFGGLKFREIAQTMDCSLSTAKNRVRWGLTKMADLLDPTHHSKRRSVAESSNEPPHDL